MQEKQKMIRWQTAADFLALKRHTFLLLVALVLAGTGEQVWLKFIPKYLLVLGATEWIIGSYDGLQTLLGAIYAYPGGWLTDHWGQRRPLMLFSALAVNLASTAGWLAFRSLLCRDQDRSRGQKKNVLIVGAGNIGRGIADYLSHNERHGRSVKGFLDEDRCLDSRIIGRRTSSRS